MKTQLTAVGCLTLLFLALFFVWPVQAGKSPKPGPTISKPAPHLPSPGDNPNKPPPQLALLDLQIKSLEFVKTQARVQVINVGTVAAGRFTVRVNLLAADNIDGRIVKSFDKIVPGLAANATVPVVIDVAPSNLLGPRTVVLDAKNEVKETNETNNRQYSNFPPAGQ